MEMCVMGGRTRGSASLPVRWRRRGTGVADKRHRRDTLVGRGSRPTIVETTQGGDVIACGHDGAWPSERPNLRRRSHARGGQVPWIQGGYHKKGHFLRNEPNGVRSKMRVDVIGIRLVKDFEKADFHWVR